MSSSPPARLTFASRAEHRAHLASQAAAPRGFRLGTTRFGFTPAEAPKPARMALTVIALERPTPDFAAVFTRNAFPGAPVLIGRRRLAEPTLGAVVVNNKVANVCTQGGPESAERICATVAAGLGLATNQVLPSSTGVIGWRLPVDAMIAALPDALTALDGRSVLPAAEAIMTTDLYPKVRRASVGDGSVVGIAKGAGMLEPNLATMLVYLMTDVRIERTRLRRALAATVEDTFNAISVDSDTSTSDTVVALSSGVVADPGGDVFEVALQRVCAELAADLVRNGEGVHHVIAVNVTGAPNAPLARGIGKAIVNSPLVKSALCGNDPNVGRILAAIGKHVGAVAPGTDLSRVRITLGEHVIFERGTFALDGGKEAALVAHLKAAELYSSQPPPDGLTFKPPLDFPPHERSVALSVDLAIGEASATTMGSDLSHEYVSENADYRS